MKMKKTGIISAMMLALVLTVSGCAPAPAPAPAQPAEPAAETPAVQAEFAHTDYVVSADWLLENIDNEDLLILDARGEEEYNKGHINGSIPVMWQAFSNMTGQPGDENWGTVLEKDALSEKLSEYGITPDKQIVVYTSPKGWGEDGRIVWMLKRAGYENAVMLDGGYEYWSEKGYEVSKDAAQITSADVQITELSDDTNITAEQLSEKIGQAVIIDTREKDEYEGATKFGESRGGHIPGAVNIVFNEFLDSDGTLKDAGQIQAILDEKGIQKEDEIITYCTAGIRSAHMQLVLDMMGYENVKNYDASFYEWAGNDAYEVEK